VRKVEGSEIYDFPIHHLEHFYAIFWSLTRSKQGTSTQSRAGRPCAATSRAARAPALLPRRPRVRRPRPRLPESSRASRPPSESGPPRGAPRFVAGRAPQYPPVRPARPYCLEREGQGLGPRDRLGSRGRAAGGRRAHIWGGSLPRRSGPCRSTFLDGAGELLPEPTATKHHTRVATTTDP
jgi:hypothetical protein